MKKTFLKLKLNDKILIRKTKKNKKNFINYIKDQKTKKIKNINNPMEEFYDFFFKNINNTKYYKENKKITFDVMKKNNFFLN
jgi:septation ring formation regulator EzrA